MSQPDQSFRVRTIEDSPRIRWGADGRDYCLLHLARDGSPLKLPASRMPIDREVVSNWSAVLIFGERSGGSRDFFQWLSETLDDEEEPWVRVEGNQWKKGLFSWAESTEQGLRESFEDCLEQIPQKEAAEGAASLIQWVRTLYGASSKTLNLLIRDLGRLPGSSARDCAQAFRIAMEKKRAGEALENLRIILIDTSEENFEDTYEVSGLAHLCARFRLPWLDRDEVAALCHRILVSADDAEPIGAASADELMVTSGGQPLLVHRLAEALAQPGDSAPHLEPRAVQQAFRHLRQSPPSAVRRWKDDFKNRFEEDPEIGSYLKDFAAGTSLGSSAGLSRAQIQLFYSGWIRFDPLMKRWKISSKLHAEYARTVLDELRSR